MFRLQSGGEVHIAMALVAGIVGAVASPFAAFFIVEVVSEGDFVDALEKRHLKSREFGGSKELWLVPRWELVVFAIFYVVIVLALWASCGWAIWRYILN